MHSLVNIETPAWQARKFLLNTFCSKRHSSFFSTFFQTNTIFKCMSPVQTKRVVALRSKRCVIQGVNFCGKKVLLFKKILLERFIVVGSGSNLYRFLLWGAEPSIDDKLHFFKVFPGFWTKNESSLCFESILLSRWGPGEPLGFNFPICVQN